MKNKKFWINPNTQGIFLGDSTLLLKTKKNQKKSKNRIPTYRISGPENGVKKFQKPLSKCKK